MGEGVVFTRRTGILVYLHCYICQHNKAILSLALVEEIKETCKGQSWNTEITDRRPSLKRKTFFHALASIRVPKVASLDQWFRQRQQWCRGPLPPGKSKPVTKIHPWTRRRVCDSHPQHGADDLPNPRETNKKSYANRKIWGNASDEVTFPFLQCTHCCYSGESSNLYLTFYSSLKLCLLNKTCQTLHHTFLIARWFKF